MLGIPRIDKAVLLGPSPLARIAARSTKETQARWLLHQPRDVRASYVSAVLDADHEPDAQEVWLLRQCRGVRASYVREVLDGAPDPQATWMLRQPNPVRASYIREVLERRSAHREK